MSSGRQRGKILVLSSRPPQRIEAELAAIDWRPVLSIVPRLYEMKVKILDLHRYHGVLFTSVHAVEVFVAALRSVGKDARSLAGLRLAVVGGQTADALRARLLEPDLVGEDGGESLGQTIVAEGWSGPLLYPRGTDGRQELVTALQQSGIGVDVVPAYDAILDEEQLKAALAASVDPLYLAVVLGSPRIATRWLELGGDRRLPYGVLGATTAKVLFDAGIDPVVTSSPSLESLVVTLAQSFAGSHEIE